MSANEGGKLCAGQLRYAQFVDWYAAVTFYFLEKLGPQVWMIARPLCLPAEEDAEEEIPESSEEEVVSNGRISASYGARTASMSWTTQFFSSI